jgi:non-ribosomal peptide synthetase component F
LRPGNSGVQTSRFDLAIFMHESPQGLQGSFIYSTDLFDGATIKRLADCFGTLLQHIIEQPDDAVDALELYTEVEQQQRIMQKQERRISNIRELLQMREEEIQFHDPF